MMRHRMHHRTYLVNNMEITKREILFSVIIIFIMLVIGVCLDSKIQDSKQEELSEYYRAVKIENQEMFQYALDTSAGNALVYGEITAVDPVGFNGYDGEYYYIEKVYEHYTRHTRTVTSTDSKGKTKTRVEVYYTWDVVDRETKKSKSFNIYGSNFENPINGLPYQKSGNFRIDSDDRYHFVYVPDNFIGTMETKIGKDEIYSFYGESDIRFYYNQSPNEVISDMENSLNSFQITFWIGWILLTSGCVALFCYFDNRWLED